MSYYEVYRMCNTRDREPSAIGNGYVYLFQTPYKDSCNECMNTFDYGIEKKSKKAYRKHFFLTLEDLINYKKLCHDEVEFKVDVYQFSEDTIINNLGMGKYVVDKNKVFTPFEIAVTSTEIFSLFDNPQEFPVINPLSRRLISKDDLNKIFKGTIDINANNYKFDDNYSKLYSIGSKLFEENQKDILLCKDYFDVPENRESTFQKIKVYK